MHLSKETQGKGSVQSAVRSQKRGKNRSLRIRKGFELGSHE